MSETRVPGARLYTERAGEGPALVLVSGGGGDAAMYEAVVPLLADRFTVITFDRRGNSRSPLDGEPGPASVAEQAEDVVAILDHYGIDRAFVFGNSGGALITLALLAKHSDRLLGAVVHEPPIIEVLPDRDEQRKIFDELARITAEEGALRAYLFFAATTMAKPPKLFQSSLVRAAVAAVMRVMMAVGRIRRGEPDGMHRLLGNADLVMRWEVPAFIKYEPDLEALRAIRVPWCFATGRESEGRFYARPAHVLSEQLGAPCAEFPGGHVSYQQVPEEFTASLMTILDGFPAEQEGAEAHG